MTTPRRLADPDLPRDRLDTGRADLDRTRARFAETLDALARPVSEAFDLGERLGRRRSAAGGLTRDSRLPSTMACRSILGVADRLTRSWPIPATVFLPSG